MKRDARERSKDAPCRCPRPQQSLAHELPRDLRLCLGPRRGRRPEAFATRFRALGLNTVTLAGSYHAGKFLRPHGTAGKVYFPEDGTVYFRTDP